MQRKHVEYYYKHATMLVWSFFIKIILYRDTLLFLIFSRHHLTSVLMSTIFVVNKRALYEKSINRSSERDS